MKRNYPVLYLLHGLFGSCNNWLELTGLTDYVAGKELIIVLPDGGDGWYTDSAIDELGRFQGYLIDELIPEIEAVYNTIEERTGRAIFGLSMGGYGALKFGLKRPDLFVFAGSISGAFEAPAFSDANPGHNWEELGPSILKAFGEENSSVRQDNDLFRIVEKIESDRVAGLPHFYLRCGTEDGFLEANRRLAALLEQKSIPYEYLETPGGHDWDYWNHELKNVLEIVSGQLKAG